MANHSVIVMLLLSIAVSCDAQALISLAQTTYTVIEGEQVEIKVEKTGTAASDINIVIEVSGKSSSSENQDFISTSQAAVISAGTNTLIKPVLLTTVEDNIPEPDETFILTLRITNGHGILSEPSTGKVIIIASDFGYGVFGFINPRDIHVNEVPGSENVANLMVKRDRGTFGDINLQYQIFSYSSEPASKDVIPIMSNVTFFEGETLKPLSLFIVEDNEPEIDETFQVVLTDAISVYNIDPSGTGPIINTTQQTANITVQANDAPVRFQKSVYHSDEPLYKTRLQIVTTRGITLNGKTIGPVNKAASVRYYVEPLTAESNKDFVVNNGTLTFAPGATQAMINVDILNDNIPEVAETFMITLYGVQGDVVIKEPYQTVVTVNSSDDPNGVISFKVDEINQRQLVQINEDSGSLTATFVVVRNGGNFGKVSVDWELKTLDDNKVSSDVQSSSVSPTDGIVIFLEGETEKVIFVNIASDTTSESAEVYMLHLIPNSVQGVAGEINADLVVEDSDMAYGVITFTDDTAQSIITDTSPRKLSLTLQRGGGTLGNINVQYTAVYTDLLNNTQVVFLDKFPSVTIIPAGQSGHTFDVGIRDDAFLTVGSYFTIYIVNVQVAEGIRSYNSPVVGSKSSVEVVINDGVANGEVSLGQIEHIYINEPEDLTVTNVISIPVNRIGTNGFVSVFWSLTGTGLMADLVTSGDIQPIKGTLTMTSGQSTGNIIIEVLPDNLAETDEEITLNLDRVEPSVSQRLNPVARSIKIVIKENDKAGGMFEFSPLMKASYIIEEELDPITITVIRQGAALVTREVEYYIDSPAAEAEFYGAKNVLIFLPGDIKKTATLLAKKDGIPELNETFQLKIQSFGDTISLMGSRTVVNITVLQNESPFGVIKFVNDTVIYMEESKVNSTAVSFVPVLRTMGRFGSVTVDWTFIDPHLASIDVHPLNGTVSFGPGEAIAFIEIVSLIDQLPEMSENFTLLLENSTNGATLGSDKTAVLVIMKNDDAIYFKDPSKIKTEEGSKIQLTVVREGDASSVVSVKYRTADGTASARGLDFINQDGQELIFNIKEYEKIIEILTLEDVEPETDEVFYVKLYDAKGDIAVYKTPIAEVIIAANDGANGVFQFNPSTHTQYVEEGENVELEIFRLGGQHSKVLLHWEILSNTTDEQIPNGTEFVETSGILAVEDLQLAGVLQLTALKDGIPEYDEVFKLVLYNVTGGGPSGQQPELGVNHLYMYVTITQNDDPFGVFSFAPLSREVNVAEDFVTGREQTTVTQLTVERTMGHYNDIKVAWEVFSYEIAGGGNLPDFIDLLCVGVPGPGMIQDDVSQRPHTGTLVYMFNGCKDCFLFVPRVYHLDTQSLQDGFSISGWIKPDVGSSGYILAKTTKQATQHYYSLSMFSKKSNGNVVSRLQFQYSLPDNPKTRLVQSNNLVLTDGLWHHILINIVEGEVHFYVDSQDAGKSTLVAYVIADGQGDLYVGAIMPGQLYYTGLMQDIRLFDRMLYAGEIKELHDTPSSRDLQTISGYLMFPEGVTRQQITIKSVDDLEEEANDVFAVKLVSANKQARISEEYDLAVLTVLKSDNANGLFAFSKSCQPEQAGNENQTFVCVVDRKRGDAGTVILTWEILQSQDKTLAHYDFVNATGTVLFSPGERQQSFTLTTLDDDLPELTEDFLVHLLTVEPTDGVLSTTPNSGASIDQQHSTNNISIFESDYPYGLIQFAADQLSSEDVTDVIIKPLLFIPQLTVPEEIGVLTLIVERALGVVGKVGVEWRTIDGTAKSFGKTQPDYQAAVGHLIFKPSEQYKEINITILDNTIPENAKYFEVELLNPSGGAQVGLGSTIRVNIKHSDSAHGVFLLAGESLKVVTSESNDNTLSVAIFKVIREGGTIGEVNLTWHIVNDSANDLVNSFGVTEFENGQAEGEIEVVVRDDTIPELEEVLVLKLDNVTQGSLGEDKTSAELIIQANDDPYGVVVISKADRPKTVEEANIDVEVTIERVPTSGSYGQILIHYETVSSSRTPTYISGGSERADGVDFNFTSGSVIMNSGERAAVFNVSIIDDTEPEEDESVYVVLTGVELLQSQQEKLVDNNSPRLGDDTEIYGQIIIIQNDNPGGLFELSSDKVIIQEGYRGSIVNVVRTYGAFGRVSVNLEVVQGTATAGLDYSVISSHIDFLNGERIKAVPITIIDDIIPELKESFTIRLLDDLPGDAKLGNQTETIVTISNSDDPQGAFGFETESMSIKEAGLGERITVDIVVVRLGGTLGVVAVEWAATVENVFAVDDVSPTFGSLYFVSNQARQLITLNILHDDIPEGDEVITISLVTANNGGRVLENRDRFNLIILPNDNPHGTVQFNKTDFILLEPEQKSLQYVPVDRIGGNYGQLRVYYTFQEIDVLYEATKSGHKVIDYFGVPRSGKPLPIAGTSWNVKTQTDPLLACATFCLLSEVCMSFDYHTERVDCNWFSSGDYDALDNRTGYMFYVKDQELTTALYTQQARVGIDFTAVTQQTITIDNGQSEGLIPVQILPDTSPELSEKFLVQLLSVELIGELPLDSDNVPKIGSTSKAYIIVASNDDANGMFRIYSNDPNSLDNGQIIEVEERDKLSVELVVERQGGSIGTVSVSWHVIQGRTTAAKNTDFIADGATLTLEEGETQRAINIAIEDDKLPENDEIIVVELYNPQGGAQLGPPQYSQAMVLIMANDHVAGVLAFTKTSYVIKEGDLLTITVSRTQPALGRLSVSWNIVAVNSLSPEFLFSKHAGNIFFNKGETGKQIVLSTIVDDKPKINQEYMLQLTQVVTEGVRDTGAAAISLNHGTAVITIQGGNDPHGVFGFTKSSIVKRALENEGIIQVPVDRKYGTIGAVQISYTIKPGSLQPTGTIVEAASPGLDFVPRSSHVTIYDGESSTTIPVEILDDDLAEIDEVFLVELVAVKLLSPQNSSFYPRIDNTARTSEVLITANDGTQGEVIFPLQYANITVKEGRKDLTLIVRRTKGTFGSVSVFCFAQNAKDGAVRGDDFNFDPRDIHFGPGVSEQIITVEILEDPLPEPDEVFEIILASPRNGLTIGTPNKAVITILASDEASGIVNFDSPVNISLIEPSANSNINSKATVTLIRAPGAFGVVEVPFVMLSSDMEAVVDLVPTQGIFLFEDKQNTASIEVQAVNDDIPEEVEVFTMLLNTPEGGASLGTLTQKTIVIDRNDSPYGLLQIFPLGSRDHVIEVEEDVGAVYFEVLRQSGSLGWVSVDLITSPSTATTQRGHEHLYVGKIQQLQATGSIKWYSFSSQGRTYSILLNPSQKGSLQTGIGTQGGTSITEAEATITKYSVLYLWQGALTPVQSVETNGASDAASFTIDNVFYLVITNKGGSVNFDTSSRLYTLDMDGSLVVVQDLPSKGATSVLHYIHKHNHYLLLTNYQNNNGQTNISSYIYRWDHTVNRFGSLPVQHLKTTGAVQAKLVEIKAEQYLVVASYMDSAVNSFHLNSVIYKLDMFGVWNVHQLLATRGAVDITTFTTGPLTYLIIANQRDNTGDYTQNVVVYLWEDITKQFGAVQQIETDHVLAVKTFVVQRTVFLTIASLTTPSAIYKWTEDQGQFTLVYTHIISLVLYPLTIDIDGNIETYLLDIEPADLSGDQMLSVYQVNLQAESDYIQRNSRLIFGPGQTSVVVAVYINDDIVPEDTEDFYIELINPRNGAELGRQSNVTMKVLSNDNGHGVIEFAQDSLIKYVDELASGDNDVQLNVVRRQGSNGRVVVRWKLTGQHNGITDLTPVEGLVEFSDGQSAVTVILTVKDDGIPELDETSYVSLVEVVESGSTIIDRGATLGDAAISKVIVIASDSPHGVVMWTKLHYITSEPEGSDSRLTLNIKRTQGSMGDIRISYMTVLASSLPISEQAVSGKDYVAVHGTVEMTAGVVGTSVDVAILADHDPEISESFHVNLTDVVLFGPMTSNGVAPSISPPHRLATVTIRENDNARGVLDFGVVKNAENRIDTYEGQGTIKLKVIRTVGTFGDIEVTWQTTPREADSQDYTPSGGAIMFKDGQTETFIEISITDDVVPELLQTFEVQLLRVTSGGATLGPDNTVRVGILKNDSPNGVFSFIAVDGKREKYVKESVSLTDPEGVVSFDIIRHGTDGEVVVQWRLNAAAVQDFIQPLAGTVTFKAGESRKTISIRTKPDTILEGEERFTISLVSANNNGDISPLYGDATVIILPDVGASGMVSVVNRLVYIGEPSAEYDGVVRIAVIRGPGAFGEVEVSWQILRRDSEAFVKTQGVLTLEDGQHNSTVKIVARDDSNAELRTTYTFELTSATGGATIDRDNQFCEVMYGASDYPHGLFEFKQPPEVVIAEESMLIRVPVVRNYGSHGLVEVYYTSDAGTATDVDDGTQDFVPNTGVLTFDDLQTENTIEIQIINDNVAEGPEYFFVNLTKVELLTYSNNNYTVIDGVQLDIIPAIGPLSAKIIVIDKNDNAEGTVQFTPEATNFVVHEDEGVASLTVSRHPGIWGDVEIHFIVIDGTAVLGQDFIVPSYIGLLKDGRSKTTLNITIVNDLQREFEEYFEVKLVQLTGGGILGALTTSKVTIAKSDYPNGKFSFLQPNYIVLPNPSKDTVVSVVLERTEGLLGRQTIKWRIMGPNNRNRLLEETNDVSYFRDQGQQVTQGTLMWEDGQAGTKSFSLAIKKHNGWEIEKRFLLLVYDIQGFPSNVGSGQIDPLANNYTLIIQKQGDPNGIVRFDGVSQIHREVDEPSSGSTTTLVFPLIRREGVLGDIKVSWKLEGLSVNTLTPDTNPLNGVVTIQGGKKDGQIVIEIVPDDMPELDEKFKIVLTGVEGGAEVDTTYNTATFTIKYNDYPHGRFSIQSPLQTVVVSPVDLKRRVRLNITRDDGTVGRVRVTFAMTYDQAELGVSYLPSSGSVTFNSSQNHAIVHINIEPDVFLSKDSAFTITLTSINYIGVDMTEPPLIVADQSTAKVRIPQEAANSQVGFSDNLVNVNQANNLAKITIDRLGSYGTVQVAWSSGLPSNQPVYGFNKGHITPDSDTVILRNGVNSTDIYVLATPSVSGSELFSIYISEPPVTTIGGGARLRSNSVVCKIDPHGIVRFDEKSLLISVSEPQDQETQVVLTVLRSLGSEGSIQLWYSSYSGTATGGLDYTSIDTGALTMSSAQTMTEIALVIKADSLSEVDEYFYVNITGVKLLPTDISQAISPQVSKMYATAKVIIKQNSDPYGVISITTLGTNTVQEPGSIVLLIQRTKGSYGDVTIQVRTVGGKEKWDNLVGSTSTSGSTEETIGEVLGNRDMSKQATVGQDYEIMDTVVTLLNGESEKEFILYTLDDTIPEDDEYVYVYITSLTDGVRVARPSVDDGKKGYVDVVIQRNDYWSGWVGFYTYNSSYVTADEDTQRAALLTVERRNATFGNVEIYWRAVLKKGSEMIKSSDIDLTQQLLYTSNKAECHAGDRFCTFKVPIIQDITPENQTSFLVELTRVSSGGEIDPTRKFANVTLLQSDYPNGLVQFTKESQYVFTNQQTSLVSLEVERIGYQGKMLTVNYKTVPFSSKQKVAGVEIDRALADLDFKSKAGVLIFMPFQKVTSIDIVIDLTTSSEIPYPKAFKVELSDVKGNGEMGDSVSIVTMLEGQSDMWRTWAEAQQLLTNGSIDRLMNNLDIALNQPLLPNDLMIVETILSQVLDVAESHPLLQGTKKSIMGIFCNLLDNTHKEVTKGHWKLSKYVERFAFSLLTPKHSCDDCCTEEPLTSTPCQYISFQVAKWNQQNINGYMHKLLNQDYIQLPNSLLNVESDDVSNNEKCVKVVFVQYSSQQWFVRQTNEDFLNQRIISVNINNEASKLINDPVKFKIHTPRAGIPIRRAQCVYFNENSQQWTDGNGICEVTNNLALAIDDYVDCSCKHMSHYAVISDARDPDQIGYPVWFHVSCFICVIGLIMVILCHHLCSVNSMFAVSLLMHMCFAVIGTEICYIINAYLSPIHILDILPDANNYRCIVIGVFTHYFFLAQFTWMLVQTINFHKILILNDEHTHRKYVLYFCIGWGLPAAAVIIFYIATFAIYKFAVHLPTGDIYGDVHMNKDICFISNVYTGLAGLVAPVLMCLIFVSVVFIQAFQLLQQWQHYDDVYSGRQNIYELRVLLCFWGCISMTWLWGGLHLAYGHVWMLVLFCLFNITVGLFGIVAYAVVRNPCVPCCGTSKDISHLAMTSATDDSAENLPDNLHQANSKSPYMYDKGLNMSLDKGQQSTDGLSPHSQSTQLKVKRKPISSTTVGNVESSSQPVLGNMYVHPSTPLPFINISPVTQTYTKSTTSNQTTNYTRESTDFDDLIFALGTQSFIPSDTSQQDTEIRGTYDFEAVREAMFGKGNHTKNHLCAKGTRMKKTKLDDTHL